MKNRTEQLVPRTEPSEQAEIQEVAPTPPPLRHTHTHPHSMSGCLCELHVSRGGVEVREFLASASDVPGSTEENPPFFLLDAQLAVVANVADSTPC